MLTRLCGSLPFLRIGMKPAETWWATAPPRMKPRASIPATLSIFMPAHGCTTVQHARLAGGAEPQRRGAPSALDAAVHRALVPVHEHEPEGRLRVACHGDRTSKRAPGYARGVACRESVEKVFGGQFTSPG